MSARWLLNLLLLLFVVGLALLAYLRPGLDATDPPATISQNLPEQARQIQIERPGREPIILGRVDDHWQLIAPLEMPANPFRTAPLLQLLYAESHSSFPVVAGTLAQYGLAEPVAWLKIDGERYAFGGVEPLNGFRYVMHDETIYLLSDRFYHYLLMSPYDFVSLQLLPPQATLVALQISSRVVRDELLLARWSEVQARRVSAYTRIPSAHEQDEILAGDEAPAEERGLDPVDPIDGVGQVVVVLAGGLLLQFDILQRAPEFVLGLHDKGVRYHFTEEDGERLLPILEDDDA